MKMKNIVAAAIVGCMSISALTYAQTTKPIDMSADTIEYDSESGLIQATGSVKVLQENGVLTGQKAVYNSKSQQAHLFGDVYLQKDNMSLRAAEVIADGGQLIRANGGVTVSKDDKVLTGPQIEYNQGSEYVVVPSDAKITMNDGIMTSSRLEAYLNDNRIVASGNVHLISPTKQIDATSDTAEYFGNQQGQVVLNGNAVVVQEGNTLRGKRLTLFLNGSPAK